ncbi:hypothetical protein [Methylobacterium sp. Leaf108]|uniref:hypothetical protein n=1 Tax=Methylobacterium sp. Leaf108 TaxID=1736256 RepID=UPI0006F2E28F|nr:hypothetical protein [Methylobacterium sp. Leaf108]KQP55286.1 hydrolase [Methylobacterium sp. Leaf108]
MPGFDPREPETYWGLFRREARLTATRRDTPITVGDPVRSADGLRLDWELASEGQATRYTLLRWDDIVRARFPRPNGRRFVETLALGWRLWRTGYLSAYRREARRFYRVIVGIHLIYLGIVAASVALACTLLLLPAQVLPAPVAILAVPAAAYAILWWLMRITREKPFFVAHLVDDTAFTHAHAKGEAPEMEARLDAFAALIRAAEGKASEIVLIGHSSSSFFGYEALDRVLLNDPDFGTRGTPVSFVTIGSVIPWITLDANAHASRAALARVGAAAAIGWLDIRTKWDWLSIHKRDPLSASGLPSPKAHRPVEFHVRMPDLVSEKRLSRRRFNLFQMHFQLLMSSESPDTFDYISLITGAEPIHGLIERWRSVKAQPMGQESAEVER